MKIRKCRKIGNKQKTFQNATHEHMPAGTKIMRVFASKAATLKGRRRFVDNQLLKEFVEHR